MKNIFYYFVEGECEKKLINTIKEQYIFSGKVYIKNITQKAIHKAMLRTFDKNGICVMIFDTDVLHSKEKINKVLENKKVLDDNNIKYIFIYQDKNLEDEIVKSTNIKKIEDMFNVTIGKHKSKFIKCKNLLQKLKEIEFDVKKMWLFDKEELPKNESYKIKKKK